MAACRPQSAHQQTSNSNVFAEHSTSFGSTVCVRRSWSHTSILLIWWLLLLLLLGIVDAGTTFVCIDINLKFGRPGGRPPCVTQNEWIIMRDILLLPCILSPMRQTDYLFIHILLVSFIAFGSTAFYGWNSFSFASSVRVNEIELKMLSI